MLTPKLPNEKMQPSSPVCGLQVDFASEHLLQAVSNKSSHPLPGTLPPTSLLLAVTYSRVLGVEHHNKQP